SIRILDDINTAEREAAIGAMPRGRIRVNTSVPFGLHWLLPLLPGFFKLHPGISVDVCAAFFAGYGTESGGACRQ
ncbi:MAG TPA: hypothetical protein PKJ36_14585, partial [Flavihumibacter sp.]|nr:hypothetical protein [Flavihumibacter sp.]